jgi:hypothetical protein
MSSPMPYEKARIFVLEVLRVKVVAPAAGVPGVNWKRTAE